MHDWPDTYTHETDSFKYKHNRRHTHKNYSSFSNVFNPNLYAFDSQKKLHGSHIFKELWLLIGTPYPVSLN